MSRSNYDKPFYVDVGTSVVAIRCASNHDVVVQYDYAWSPGTLKLAKDICDRMNKEAEIGKPPRNCDVGTAEEQYARFAAACHAHVDLAGRCRATCPFKPSPADMASDRAECFAMWVQLPYDERKMAK